MAQRREKRETEAGIVFFSPRLLRALSVLAVNRRLIIISRFPNGLYVFGTTDEQVTAASIREGGSSGAWLISSGRD